jgi:AsmA family protein
MTASSDNGHMSLRRLAVIVLSAVGVLLAGVVLYLAFGDLGRHKGRIETLATELLGRPFAIDGAFELEVLPSLSLVAERVRLGNADWGSQPQMVEIGRVSAQVGLWSLVSGPVDVRSFELSDVAVLLETSAEGKGNWAFGEAAPAEAAEPGAGSATALPAVILRARLANVRTIYRERGKPDRVALIESLSIAPGSDGLLAIAGKGRLNELPAALNGEIGPLEALFAGRDIRMAIQAALGELQVDVKGGLGRLDPLDGADLGMKIAHPDIGSMLRKLHLPVVVAGSLAADARLGDAGDLTRLDLAARLGDITVKVGGTLRALGLPGSDLRIDAAVANVARHAAALDVTGLPAGALELGGRFVSSRTEIKLDGLSARYAGARARVSGTVRLAGEPGAADLRFELAAESLRKLKQGLPEMPFSVSGNYAGNRGKLEVKNLKGRIGKDEISGRASLVLAGRKRAEIELASPRLDLTPFAAAGSGAKPAGDARAKPKAEPKFVFDEAPLPLEKLKVADARLHFRAAEVRLDKEVLRDVESTLLVDRGRLALEARMRDGVEGIVTGAVKLAASDGGAAALDVSISAKNTRAGLSAGDAFDPKDAPPTNVEASLLARGASARQMAAGANGRVLVTQGAGKLNSGLIGLLGGDLLRELVGKLNPFSGQDPYTKLECTVVRADIVDGEMKVNPVLLQSEKVTIVAGGEIDLRTEALRFSFNTRPRTGVGVSAGMFTNPFIELAGTLASPRLGLGAKGATSGAAAAATGGISVLAQGFLDRARGGQDLCKKTLELAVAKAK